VKERMIGCLLLGCLALSLLTQKLAVHLMKKKDEFKTTSPCRKRLLMQVCFCSKIQHSDGDYND